MRPPVRPSIDLASLNDEYYVSVFFEVHARALCVVRCACILFSNVPYTLWSRIRHQSQYEGTDGRARLFFDVGILIAAGVAFGVWLCTYGVYCIAKDTVNNTTQTQAAFSRASTIHVYTCT
jgi:hypothetical protein